MSLARDGAPGVSRYAIGSRLAATRSSPQIRESRSEISVGEPQTASS